MPSFPFILEASRQGYLSLVSILICCWCLIFWLTWSLTPIRADERTPTRFYSGYLGICVIIILGAYHLWLKEGNLDYRLLILLIAAAAFYVTTFLSIGVNAYDAKEVSDTQWSLSIVSLISFILLVLFSYLWWKDLRSASGPFASSEYQPSSDLTEAQAQLISGADDTQSQSTQSQSQSTQSQPIQPQLITSNQLTQPQASRTPAKQSSTATQPTTQSTQSLGYNTSFGRVVPVNPDNPPYGGEVMYIPESAIYSSAG